MIGIIDYNAGNIRSVEHALAALNCEYVISKNPAELERADKLIFPGVGDARYAMEQLKQTGFDSFLKDKTAAGIPILGICLGSQIIFDYSEEGDTECLGLVPGRIRHFSSINKRFPFKVPHMGWNDIYYTETEKSAPCRLFTEVPEHTAFYFVHSYVIQPEDTRIVTAAADYGISVPAAIRSGNVYALQFHPEKSGEPGLRILKNFAERIPPAGGC
ncbi:imidazole glycerol phosphate synthase subunit HisH [Treponema brennaborense]|uniref:Imidazole glycerol phosphate synthase subunit HisH n=1 Tax=Treponema brennaborense (strain DSM 12168 / CIP 105900 / DD5/3) TaxID=906968 RepID=F4LIE8_TREBD|nr:imidazole glycerol phosphate synthase subunit HisH [Treponema brennaborense]AEE16189.1 Imidazole glycerol phosphate synthase subunit hisH [Treponema brennaborense DSM 12168]